MTLRTREMRRSAFVNVPSFSRNDEPGRKTCANLRGLVEKQVLDDDAFHGRQRRGDMLRVRIGLREVLALDVHALEAAIERRLEHVGNAQARLGPQRARPTSFSNSARVASSETWR